MMRCWYCHEAEMKETEDKVGHPYRKCPKCGATDTDIPELGPPALARREYSYSKGSLKWKPHPVSKRKAKK